jgi:hypothetical protein
MRRGRLADFQGEFVLRGLRRRDHTSHAADHFSCCRHVALRLILSSRPTEEDTVGLMLFPGDGDVTSPDVSWSYTGFHLFREWLASTEGFTLAEMHGFGGDRAWSGVSTTLAVLDRQATDRFTAKLMHGRHQPRFTVRGGRPGVTLELLERAVTVHDSSHRPIVPRWICSQPESRRPTRWRTAVASTSSTRSGSDDCDERPKPFPVPPRYSTAAAPSPPEAPGPLRAHHIT